MRRPAEIQTRTFEFVNGRWFAITTAKRIDSDVGPMWMSGYAIPISRKPKLIGLDDDAST